MDQQQFARRVFDITVRGYPEFTDQVLEGMTIKGRYKDTEVSVGLSSLYVLYVQHELPLDELVSERMGQMLGAPDWADWMKNSSWEGIRSQIMLAVRPKEYVREIPEVDDGVLTVTQTADFDVHAVIDAETTMATFTTRMAAHWGVGRYALAQAGLANLRARSEERFPELLATAKENQVFIGLWGDSYDSSRILLPEFYDRVSGALSTYSLAWGVPSRDKVHAVSASKPGMVLALHASVNDYYRRDPYPISPRVFLLDKANPLAVRWPTEED